MYIIGFLNIELNERTFLIFGQFSFGKGNLSQRGPNQVARSTLSSVFWSS